MNITDTLTLVKKKVDANLSSFFASKESSLLLTEVQRIFNAGGKRTRATLAYHAYQTAGGVSEQEILNLASAIELFHVFALIHDDIIDHAPLRRNVVSVNKKIGVPQAILAGDLALVLSVELFQRATHSLYSKRRQTVMPIWERFMEDVLYGESLDVHLGSVSSLTKPDLEQKIWEMMELKTARYSVVYPMQLGVALAGGSNKLLPLFADYGMNAGCAFQLHDDLLGMFGDENVLGKPVDSDLKEGKMTLLMAKLRAKITHEGKWNDLQWVRTKLIELGIKKECEEIEQKLVAKAKRTIVSSSLSPSSQRFFLDFADFIIKRTY